METVFQYRIPVWHPLVVHLPLALLLTAALAAVIWMIGGRPFWRRCLLFLVSVGMVGGLLAYNTGEAMAAQAEGVPIVEQLAELHEQMAFYTLLANGLLLLGLGGVSFWLERRTTIERNPDDPLMVRIGLGLLVLLAAALVAWTAHIGGTMVWGVAA